ncbi:MAG: hypothetical protein WBP12_04970 [Candidatus Saccharimonas sp.]
MTEFLYNAFYPQNVDFIGSTLGMYRLGVILLAAAIICAILTLIVFIARFISAGTAGGWLAFSLVVAIVGALLTFINLDTGHERYTMIQDLQSAGWRVIALDETKDTALVGAGDTQIQVNLREVTDDGRRWEAYLRCAMSASPNGAVTDTSSCTFTPPPTS